MSEIDISNNVEQEVDVIRFADDDDQVVIKGRNGVLIVDNTYNEVHIINKEHAEHLILALQEAINRGWLV